MAKVHRVLATSRELVATKDRRRQRSGFVNGGSSDTGAAHILSNDNARREKPMAFVQFRITSSHRRSDPARD